MKLRGQEASGEVGRVTPCAPLLGWPNAAGVTRPANRRFMSRAAVRASVCLCFLLLLSLSARAQS